MRRINDCLFLERYRFLLPFCAIATIVTAMEALYLCSARNIKAAMQLAGWMSFQRQSSTGEG
jgi:hypothetical protein